VMKRISRSIVTLALLCATPAGAMLVGDVPDNVMDTACALPESAFDAQIFSAVEREHVISGIFDITINDAAGVGYNDPVLGADRMLCLTTAAGMYSDVLITHTPIELLAGFPEMFANATSAVLGATGTSGWARDFPGAPIANTWYQGALADTHAGTDLVPSQFDIVMNMNRAIDDPATLGGRTWYYGTDANPGVNFDCITVLLHELAHGLGLTTRMLRCGDVNNPDCAAFVLGSPAATMRNMEDHTLGMWTDITREERIVSGTGGTRMHQVGPRTRLESARFSQGKTGDHVQYHSPGSVSSGSSWSHPSTTMFPNDLMEPFYPGASHDIRLVLGILEDQGWPTTRVGTVTTSSTTSTTLSPPICSSQCDLDGNGRESATDALIALRVATVIETCPNVCQ